MDYKRDEIKEHLDDYLADNKTQYDDIDDARDRLHQDAFNSDYYIIGRYKAIKWLGDEAFNVIGFIKEWEQENFGEIYTDLSEPEKVVNMYTFLIGMEETSRYLDQIEEWIS
tara:strand:- start:3099 stop:3434 length:336 start_codon:yes stop_codon:yes gene_type:complete